MTLSHDETTHHSKIKRIKVLKACFSCRIKKIKCDGIQPCMQCEARKIECSFSKYGSLSQDKGSISDHPISTAHHLHSNENDSEPKSVQFPISVQLDQQKIEENDRVLKVSQILDRLSTVYPDLENREYWEKNINTFFNNAWAPAKTTPTDKNNNNSNSNNKVVNYKLLDLFFRHRYVVFPFIPKTIFYRLIEQSDHFITPLLLNSIYCHAAHFSYDECTEALHYFKRAEQLLDYYLDKPSTSTVVALCLMSFFESGRYDSIHHIGLFKPQTYSDMAFRMCFDLKLHDPKQVTIKPKTIQQLELDKRVYWLCFCLDKIQSLITNKPSLILSKDARVELPSTEIVDNIQEEETVSCFLEAIELMKITEQILQVKFPLRSIDENNLEYDVLVKKREALFHWIKSLPLQLQWSPLDENDLTPNYPPQNAAVAYLHLLYNLTEIYLLQSLPSPSMKRAEQSIASNITQLICAICDQVQLIPSFRLVSEAIMAAIRSHVINCADKNLNIARNARFMFQRSLRSLQSITQYRVIDGVEEFIINLEKAILSADEGRPPQHNSKINEISNFILDNSNSTTATTISTAAASAVIKGTNNNPNNTVTYTTSLTTGTIMLGSKDKGPSKTQIPICDTSSYLRMGPTAGSIYPKPSYFPDTSTFAEPPGFPSLNKNDIQGTERYTETYTSMHSNHTMMINRDTHYNLTSELMDASFIDTKQRQNQAEEMKKTSYYLSNKMDTPILLGRRQEMEKMDGNSNLLSASGSDTREKHNMPMTYLREKPPTKSGLGVYASAQQHYIDIVSQYYAGFK